MARSFHRSVRFGVFALLALAGTVQAQTFSITRAEWSSSDGGRLRVEGTGTNGRTVTIKNAGNGAVLGNTTVDGGDWSRRFSNLSQVPCRVRAEQSAGGAAERDVSNRPANCGPTAGAQPGISINDATVVEGGTANFTVSLSAASTQQVTVQFATLNGTALAGSDYTERNGTLTFAPGTTTQTVAIATGNDTVAEPSETFSVNLTNGVNATIADAQGIGTITDNDSATGGTPNQTHIVLSANDLGMHCTDQDFQIFSILPPFNSLHAQVIRKGVTGSVPRILSGTEAQVTYVATSNPNDPSGAGSINTTGANRTVSGSVTVFKTNFWDVIALGNGVTGTFGSKSYRRLYPGLDKIGQCNPAQGPCGSVLDLFSPIPGELGLPVPDPNELPGLVPHQQPMVDVASLNPFSAQPFSLNQPQQFQRYDSDLAFFTNFPFGKVFSRVNWFSADGIPILPIDDAGRSNAYPLMRVQASAGGSLVAQTDIVLPVASEADCQNCHADPADFGNGFATSFASVANYADGSPLRFMRVAGAPGPEQLLNAAKINILRLHDAKHGARYTSSADGAARPCLKEGDASCLDTRRFIQCAQCHYTPALDLAQVGPIDETTMGEEGRQQTRHISMSRAMHGHHGELKSPVDGSALFPAMPAPNVRTAAQKQSVLEQTCYNCHPGKRTQCMRGAMASATKTSSGVDGGLVCQDCHGDMKQVGNDFTGTFAQQPGSFDLAKRVPWANEPKCQSCHIGDAMSAGAVVAQLGGATNVIQATDGIRLLQAYTRAAATQPVLANIQATNSRFAENESLYRFSKGHGGVMCKGCHGSTHAEWPNANPNANDNVAARQLQGHTGTIVECSTCHGSANLGNTLNGPHGMHPVGDTGFARGGHESLAESNPNACRACHGQNGQGTPLSKTPIARTINGRSFAAGERVTCTKCHDNEL